MTAIFLWSSFDPVSSQLAGQISSLPVRLINIDHPNVRKAILQSTKIRISTVPCILETSGTSLYQFEGPQAMEWLQSKMTPVRIEPERPQPPPQSGQSTFDGIKFVSSGQQQQDAAAGMPPTAVAFGPPQQVVPNDPEVPQLRFIPSAGPPNVPDPTQPQASVTPMSQVVPDPPGPSSGPVYDSVATSKAAQDHYESMGGGKSSSPKEKSFQAVLAQARASAEAQERKA